MKKMVIKNLLIMQILIIIMHFLQLVIVIGTELMYLEIYNEQIIGIEKSVILRINKLSYENIDSNLKEILDDE